MNLIKRVWCFLSRGRLVWLKDYDSYITLAIARKDVWGMWNAERWWPFSVTNCVLKDDGSVLQPNYVTLWKDAKNPTEKPEFKN